ncbi:MAG: class I tRNA ligase family protein [Candidatus Pacebacteria bacterium]|nr:class I tRNA ligase family protein [Candidatus Paceibacterota bacterium]
MTERNRKIYITTPIYYVNTKPHIGHAYTTLAADVLSRYHRLTGKDVFFLTGTDEHGAKIAQAAEKNGKEPQEFCDEISGLFKQAWKNLGIDYSYFIRTTDKHHEQKVAEFLIALKEKGFLYEGDYSGLYCVGCEKFITGKDLIDGQCPDHKCAPEKVAEKNWFFKLKEFLPQIERLINEGRILIQPEKAKQEVLGLFKQGLDDISVSRQNVTWGIKLPWDEKQTIYVWVDALLNYWTATRQDDRQDYWPVDLHLVGRDILKFHCVYWPALLLAAGLDLPKQIFCHGYFTINGQKMSKTIGNVIDSNDLITKYGLDATRYLLLTQFPFGNDGDISLERLDEKYNSDLASGLGNLVSRVLTLANNLKLQIADCELTSRVPNLEEARQKYRLALDSFQFNEALASVWDLIGFCDKYINDEKPWEGRDNSKEVVGDTLLVLREIADLLKAFMPQTSDKILNRIENGKGDSLFPRI